ncbi:unnamed protein product [Lathyrus oleraceus]
MLAKPTSKRPCPHDHEDTSGGQPSARRTSPRPLKHVSDNERALLIRPPSTPRQPTSRTPELCRAEP